MGSYVYKMTAERVHLTDGRVANLFKYAYKPSLCDSAWNSKMDKRQLAAARSLVAQGVATGLICFDTFPGSPVYKYSRASLSDDSFFERTKPIAGIAVANPNSKSQMLRFVSYLDRSTTVLSDPPRHPVVTVLIPGDSYEQVAELVIEQSPGRELVRPGQTVDDRAPAPLQVVTIVPAKPVEKPIYTPFDWE